MNLPKSFIKLFSILFIVALIGACDDNDTINTLIEDDFASDPTLSANPERHTVIKFLEAPASNQTNTLELIDFGDTGTTGTDEIPLSYNNTIEHTFCWEDDDNEAGHFLELDDSEGNQVLRLDVNGECVTVIIEAGEYIMTIFHDGLTDSTHPLFLIPNPDQIHQELRSEGLENSLNKAFFKVLNLLPVIAANKAYAQTSTPLETLVSTRRCVGCDLRRQDLSFRDMTNVDLTGANLRNANLTGADFTGAEFTSAKLVSAILTDGIFKNADFTVAKLDSAILTGANFSCATWLDGACKCESNLVYTASASQSNVSITDPMTGMEVFSPINVATGPFTLEFSLDGKFLYVLSTTEGKVSVIDTSSKTELTQITVGNGPTDMVLTPDGTKLYVANMDDGTISVIDTSSNTVNDTITGNLSQVFALAITPDGTRLYATLDSNVVIVINTSTNLINGEIKVPTELVTSQNDTHITQAMAVSPDGTTLYIGLRATDFNTFPNILTIADTSTNEIFGTDSKTPVLKTTTATRWFPRSFTLNKDGSKLYIANFDLGSTDIVTTASLQFIGGVSLGGTPIYSSLSRDGSSVYVANEMLNSVTIIDTATDGLAGSFINTVTPTGVEESPDISIGGCVGCQ